MNPTDHQIIETMEQRGGGFVYALAQCFRKADPHNAMRLKSEFSDYWEDYRFTCIKELETAEREKAGAA